MSDFQLSLASQIRLERSQIKPYDGFIFLCGGHADATALKPTSIRDAIYRELAKSDHIERRIRLAEHYKDWAHNSIYNDLLLFEQHLAELSSLIVLVLESPGAIAELGLFATLEEFRDKLLVFMDVGHYKEQSFIRLGPINYLEKVHKNQTECYAWIKRRGDHESFDNDEAELLQVELAEAITTRLKRTTSAQPFNDKRWLHVALFICDLINLFSALSLREIHDCLERMGVQRKESEIKQALYLLERVGLLVMEPSGMQRFYVANDDRQFLQFHLETSTFDLDRFRTDVLGDYRKNDKKRFRAIQAVRQRVIV